jgi:His/Glu/Gln/Arg/opine family amino acid ABC transporter permease subunit
MLLALGFEWSYISENWEVLARGLKLTFEISAIGIFGAFLIGVVFGAARAYRIPVANQLAAIYVEVFRCTPILLQIFFLFFGLPQLGVTLDGFTVAWLALVLWGGAYNIENFRAGFGAVPYRYREAGFALGLGRKATFLNVSLPLGGRIALPASINTYISIVKNSALFYPIGFNEFTTVSLNINALTLQTSEVFITLGVVYLAIVWSMSIGLRYLEGHLALPGRA